MRPPPVFWCHLKRSFWRSDFLIKYHQNPQALKRQSKEKIEEEKEKLQESLQIKERRKTLHFKKSFLMWFHFILLHHTISKTLSKMIEKVFLTLFGASLSLSIYMTWVVPFSFTMSSTYLAFRG
jgi:hypothetical protein